MGHLRTEYHKAREDCMRLSSAADKRTALGGWAVQCGTGVCLGEPWVQIAASSLHPAGPALRMKSLPVGCPPDDSGMDSVAMAISLRMLRSVLTPTQTRAFAAGCRGAAAGAER